MMPETAQWSDARLRQTWLDEGFEEVGERGGKLWEIYRGFRHGQKIRQVRIDPDGMSLWVRIE